MGWTGLLIEANPVFYKVLGGERRNSVSLLASVGDDVGETKSFFSYEKNGPMTGALSFVAEHGPSGWRLSEEHARLFAHELAATLRVDRVPVVSLSAEFDRLGLKRFAWLSIDAEGGEQTVIDTIDFSKITSDFITVENVPRNVHERLPRHGYRRFVDMEADAFYEFRNRTTRLHNYQRQSAWMRYKAHYLGRVQHAVGLML